MTKAEILSSVRYACNETSTDTGGLLSDTGNLADFLNDAMEQVTLDLFPTMPGQFLTSENVTLVANQANYTLTNSFIQIYKVEKNITGENPREIAIIDPLEIQYYMATGDTDGEPNACYFVGDTLYFVPTPSAAYTNYAKVWEVVREAATMATAGPTYIPAIAHRLIVYQAASIVQKMMGNDAGSNRFLELYARRLEQVRKVWTGRFQQNPRFIRDSSLERSAVDTRLSVDYDKDW
jgi:hypothetical protein